MLLSAASLTAGGRAETVKNLESNRVFIQDWRQHAPDCPLLTPNLDSTALVLPEVSAKTVSRCLCEMLLVSKRWRLLNRTILVNNPFPRNPTVLTSID